MMAQAERHYARMWVQEANVPSPVHWKPDAEFRNALEAQHAVVDGAYELICYSLPADKLGPELHGYEVYGGERHLTLLRRGEAENFAQAKLDAEKALHTILAAMALPSSRPRRQVGGAR